MKQKVCYAALITMSFLVLFYACQKELPDSDPEKKVNPSSVKLTVPEARKYYNKLKAEQGNLVKTEGTSLSNGKQPNRKYILFEKAYASETRTATFVEVPVLYNQRFAFVINKPQENTQRAREEGKEIFEASFDRLLIYRNKTTGTTDQRIITYIPEIEYLRRHKGDISHNQINKLDEDFEGFIEYKKWDGTRLYLLKIQNGKTLGRINLLKDFTKKTRGATTNSIVCETYTTENWGMSCVSADPEGYIEYCEPYIIGVTTHEFCYDNGLTGDPCIDYGDCGTGDPCIDYGMNCPGNPAPEPGELSNDQILANLFEDNPEFREAYDRLNASEKSLALQHPMAAYSVFLNSRTAETVTAAVFSGSATLHNDIADAFRHAFWNALNAHDIGAYLAKGFADAHENFPNNPDLEKSMDLINNNIGRNTALELISLGQYSEDNIRNVLIDKAENGGLIMIENGMLVSTHR